MSGQTVVGAASTRIASSVRIAGPLSCDLQSREAAQATDFPVLVRMRSELDVVVLETTARMCFRRNEITCRRIEVRRSSAT